MNTHAPIKKKPSVGAGRKPALTKFQRLRVRELLKSMSVQAIAERYGVHEDTIRNAKTYKYKEEQP